MPSSVKPKSSRLYSCTGLESLWFSSRCFCIAASDSSVEVETLCIDDLAQRENLKSVDFIKMDVEGAELEALKGARAVLCRDTPKLAISIYHNLHDFWTIPQWLDSLNLGSMNILDELEHFHLCLTNIR